MPQYDGFKTFKARMPEIQKEIDKIDRLAQACDPRILDGMTKVNNILEEYERFKDSREYQMMATDVNIIKTDVMDNCICPRKMER